MSRRGVHHSDEVEVGVVISATFFPSRRVRGIVVPVRRSVESKLGPDEKTVGETIAKQDVVREGVELGRGGVAREPIDKIGRLGDAIRVVGRRGLDGVAQGLVEEQLREMRHRPPCKSRSAASWRRRARSSAGASRGPGSGPGIPCRRTRRVGIGRLHPAQICCAEASLSRCAHAAVYAHRITRPRIDQELCCRLAGVHVDELKLDMHGHANYLLDEVRTDMFLKHEVWSVGVVGSEHTAGV